MSTRRVPSRRLAVAAGFAGACLLVSGCGSSSGTPAANESVGPATSTPSVTADPSPTQTAAPLSPYEDEPAVKAVRRWLAATARDVNANEADLPRASKLATGQARKTLPSLYNEDLGLHYPGPVPMTPLSVVDGGKTSKVLGCQVFDGFALDPKTGKPARKRLVHAVKYDLVRQDSKLLVSGFWADSADCSTTRVTGVAW